MKIFSKKQDDLFALLDEKENNSISTGETLPEPSHALTPEEVLSSKIDTSKRFDSSGALDSLKKRMRETTAKDNLTLLEKCKPYILDEQGKDASAQTKPAYTLESVDQILKTDDQKVIDKLAEKYDISFDYLGKYVEQKTAESIANQPKAEPIPQPNPEPIEPEIQREVFEEKIKINTPVKNIQSSVPYIISDIDSEISVSKKGDNDIPDGATITFTPVTAEDSAQSKIVVTTQTRPIDLTGEFEHIEDTVGAEEDSRVTIEKDDF